MRKILTLVVVALMVAAAGMAFAVPAGKSLSFDKSPMGAVTFDGNAHAQAGLNCQACHNADLFSKMKQGSVEIKMADIYAGKQCGACHNGTKAFKAMGNCGRCHKK
jgi:c(7)-type cytochrome triheme protein